MCPLIKIQLNWFSANTASGVNLALSAAVAFSISVSLEAWWVVVLYADRRLVASPDCGDRLAHHQRPAPLLSSSTYWSLREPTDYIQQTRTVQTASKICITLCIIKVCLLTRANPKPHMEAPINPVLFVLWLGVCVCVCVCVCVSEREGEREREAAVACRKKRIMVKCGYLSCINCASASVLTQHE